MTSHTSSYDILHIFAIKTLIQIR